ncbi:glycosyltransferase family 2 protein [Sorangium sp. So ce1128]
MIRVLVWILIPAGVASVTWWRNRGIPLPSYDGDLQGVAYNPYRRGGSPRDGDEGPSAEQVAEDFALLRARGFRAVRTYGLHGALARAPELAERAGLRVSLGVWLDGDPEADERELRALAGALAGARNVDRVIVGNETVLRGALSPGELAAFLARARAITSLPVGTAEPYHVWWSHPELVAASDFIAAHVLPYWEGLGVDEAIRATFLRLDELRRDFPDKPLLLGETGWPSAGRTRRAAIPGLAHQARFLRGFLREAEARNFGDYFVLEAFDQPWKREIEGNVGPHWGFLGADGAAKAPLSGPVREHPGWRRRLALGATISAILVGLFLVVARNLRGRGQLLFGAAVAAMVAELVWLAHVAGERHLSAGSRAAWAMMLGALLLLAGVVLAELRELVYCLWRREVRRVFAPRAPAPGAALPFVSLHLPIHDEPPALVVRTVRSLLALDYPAFEVLVVDNNTRDPARWQPVEAFVRRCGDRARFFHLEDWPGFKAGALNFALARSAPAAEVVGVVDCDYEVRANWLRGCVPYFDAPAVAIVQAPQDHRDGGESLFKRAITAEYDGFFRLGMVDRNEDDAIVQHGTMTLIRRRALVDAGGWDERGVCEDAELGLRLLARGHVSVYVPASLGRGLSPGSFAAYKGQRFRWAFGATQILARHAGLLAGRGEGNRLTRAQRLHFVLGWLPWIGDGGLLVASMLALAWSAAVLARPAWFEIPPGEFVGPALGVFAWKLGRTLWLYRARVRRSWVDCALAALAGLSLTPTIGWAVLMRLRYAELPFRRTRKDVERLAWRRALGPCRYEAAMATLLLAAAAATAARFGDLDPEARLWAIFLGALASPFAAAVAMSALSVWAAARAPATQPVEVPHPEALS